MLKKVIMIGMLIICVSIAGCQNDQASTKLVAQNLSEREQYLLKLTQNKVLIYDIKNLPQDKDYEIEIVYEFYKDSEKVKEQRIAAIYNDETCEKGKEDTVAINIQGDKISYLWGKDGFASGSYTLEEDLSKYSQTWFSSTANLDINTELYIYHAYSGNSSRNSITLGVPVEDEEVNKVLNANKENIFIKIVFKGI